jgi:hypothetical protein
MAFRLRVHRPMHRMRFVLTALVWCATVAAARAGEQPAGIVTAVRGEVSVVRGTDREPLPLGFKASVYVRDRITTGDDAFARVFLGGRAVVSVRERSVFTITEMPDRAIVDLTRGRAAVAVAKERMRPGESVEIRTPNTVAGIRGTVVVAEVRSGVRGVESRITVVRGLVDVRSATGGTATLGPLDRVRVIGGDIAASRLDRVTVERLVSEFRMIQSGPGGAASVPSDAALERAIRDADVQRERSPLRSDVRREGRQPRVRQDDRDGEERGPSVAPAAPYSSSGPASSGTSGRYGRSGSDSGERGRRY